MQHVEPVSEQTVETHEVAVPDENNRVVWKLTEIVWYITGFIVAIHLVRFVLAMLGANLANPFANFIYAISDPFVAPFRGLLQVGQFQAGISRIEVETLLAALIYFLIGWGIVAAIRLARR